MAELRIGQHVRHVFSGWEGHVTAVRRDDTGMAGAQGPLVTVELTSPLSPGPRPWKPITVTAAELEPTGKPSEAAAQLLGAIRTAHETLEDLNANWFLIDDNERRVRMQNALGVLAGPLLDQAEGT